MSFDIGFLRFIDSLQLMSPSFEKLVENLYNPNPATKYDNFNFTKKVFGKDVDLLCRKGHYPYEWVDDISKLDHIGLPSQDQFDSQLTQSNISEADYKHANTISTKMKCQTFKDYLHYL